MRLKENDHALVALLRRYLNKEDEARALIRELFVSIGGINQAGAPAPGNRSKNGLHSGIMCHDYFLPDKYI